MDGGGKIYPHEGLSVIETEIEKIRKRTVFGRDTFEFTLGEEKFNSLNKIDLEQSLIANNYELKNASNYISREIIEQVNQQYLNFDIEETYRIALRTRLTFTPQDE